MAERALKTYRVRIDPELIDIVPVFIAHRRQDVASLHDALAHGDSSLIRKIAHNLKGAGSSFGFDTVSAIGERMERAATQGRWPAVAYFINLLARYLETVEPVCE
ncbi:MULTISPECIES: Hpt domain-containing protein [Geobacter]|uniref:Hpt domain-containing protein n=1 Tax=Geobacter TaxID=28231 RepID=UPI0025744A84|nr:Hpt domain-containing protein [Geobacter sulfurreducens]BEH10745.1 Hpt domain-containing protein [Geobacter sulfurreducens subsp. ethanolicus]BET58590.1 Hpt domain-containing protein [Geobacter sp. 60473]